MLFLPCFPERVRVFWLLATVNLNFGSNAKGRGIRQHWVTLLLLVSSALGWVTLLLLVLVEQIVPAKAWPVRKEEGLE